MGDNPNDVIALDRRQPASKLGPSSKGDMRVHGIDIEGNMEGLISKGVQVLDGLLHDRSDPQLHHVVHGEALHVVLLQVHPLVPIDVADAHQDDVLEGDALGQPLEAWDGRGQACHVGHWVAVVVFVGTLLGVDEIWMGVDPDDLEVLVVAVEGVEGGRAD